MYMLTDNKGKNYGLFENLTTAYDEIKRQVKLLNFDSGYIRENLLDDRTIWVDYGSHTHFFYIKEVEDGEV